MQGKAGVLGDSDSRRERRGGGRRPEDSGDQRRRGKVGVLGDRDGRERRLASRGQRRPEEEPATDQRRLGFAKARPQDANRV
jgi:hypothetical protein